MGRRAGQDAQPGGHLERPALRPRPRRPRPRPRPALSPPPPRAALSVPREEAAPGPARGARDPRGGGGNLLT